MTERVSREDASREGGELTSVRVCWACFCCALLATQSIQVIDPRSRTEAAESTYHVAFAFEEGLDRVVQLLNRNRHAAAEIGDLAGESRKGCHDTKVRGYKIKREVDEKLAVMPTSLKLWEGGGLEREGFCEG